jgi:uncharacterized alpha-E superfamily protein
MLSRLAERFYWLSRYIERAENTARLISAHDQLLLDLPPVVDVLWRSLIEILGVDSTFRAGYRGYTERNVLRFALTDERSASSIVSALRLARENARTVREILPSEGWEQINQLFLSTNDHAPHALNRKHRQAFFDRVVKGTQQLSGLFHNSLSRRAPYHFLSLGAAIERADMTSRILDVGALYASGRRELELAAYNTALWTNVLLSLSGYQMYRQEVRSRVTAAGVVGFLLHDGAFPHAIGFCLDTADAALRALPQHTTPRLTLDAARIYLDATCKSTPTEGALHAYLDGLQTTLGDLHAAVERTWFKVALN